MSLVIQHVGDKDCRKWLRSYTDRVKTMLEHFSAYRITRGSGVNDRSCCAVTLSDKVVFGNSRTRCFDKRAFELGEGHAELVAYQLGKEPDRVFCELSPCDRCQAHLARDLERQGKTLVLNYLFEYPAQRDQWLAFHLADCRDQLVFFRRVLALEG